MQTITTFDVTTIKAALETLIPTGIFDTVSVDDTQTGFETIQCYKDSVLILTLSMNTTNDLWTVTPYIAASTPAASSHKLESIKFNEGYICTQGLYLITTAASSTRLHLLITKGNNGKLVTIKGSESSSFNIISSSNLYTTCMGDDTSSSLYTGGYKLPGYFSSSATTTADRTQTLKIPIVGSLGSSGYVTGVKGVYMRQFAEQGTIYIDGQKYYCAYRYAILDE